MKTQKVVLFDRYESAALAAAARSMNIAFPVDGPDAMAPDDPRRRALRGISHNDAITGSRLMAAYESLEILLAAITEQCERSYWLAQLGGATAYEDLEHGPRVMIDTLVDARHIQRREVFIAHTLVVHAWNQVANDEQTDDDVLDRVVEQADEALSAPAPTEVPAETSGVKATV